MDRKEILWLLVRRRRNQFKSPPVIPSAGPSFCAVGTRWGSLNVNPEGEMSCTYTWNIESITGQCPNAPSRSSKDLFLVSRRFNPPASIKPHGCQKCFSRDWPDTSDLSKCQALP
jgi:hypothetical protein